MITRHRFLRIAGLSIAARRLIAAIAPKRWALVIDAQKCIRKEGCTKCIEACHLEHNVPTFQDRRHEVKWIWKEPFQHAFPSERPAFEHAALTDTVLPVLCNQCDNPPCARVCPTQATWKREDDGIVMMDWHRCIGCRYCIAACPYGSRSFNWLDPRPRIARVNAEYPTRTKGVVEKCTFCEERLRKGQPPACVAVCPAKAMIFGNLNDPGSEVRQALKSRFAIRRKPELGTQPQVYYIV